MAWSLKGSYAETCSCELMCPCNLSFDHGATYDFCRVTLVFNIREGQIDGTDIAGLKVAAIADTPKVMTDGNWRLGMYLDERASDEQQSALEAIFTGRLGGDALEHFPWAWKASELVGVRRVAIELDHTRRRQWLRIRDRVTVRIRDRYAGEEAVTCVVSGHDQDGEELVADELRVDDGPLSFEYNGICGYAASFDYSG